MTIPTLTLGFKNDITDDYEKTPLSKKKKDKINWLPWILLAIMVICCSSVGPFFLFLNCNRLLKGSWRLAITSILILPFVFYEYLKNPAERAKYTKKVLLHKKTLVKIFISSFANILWTSALIFAIQNTSMAHAVLLNNTHSLYIVLFRLINRYNY